MPNPDLIPVPFAQDGQKNTIQLDRVVSDPVYRATWAEGFPADTRIPKEVGGEGPDGLDFNGILNALSQAIVFLQKGNAYQFDASLAPYPIGALVRSNDNLTTYQSTIAGNSNDPNSNMTGWRVYNGQGFIVDNLTTDDSTKTLSAKQGKALQDNKLEKTDLKDASTTQKGVVRAATATEVANKSNVNAYVTPKNVADMFVGSFTEQDSITLPNGLILQWCKGVSTTVGDADFTIQFPRSFPNACLSVQVTTIGGAVSQTDGIFHLRSMSKASCVVNSQVFGTGSISAGITPVIFAIGY